MDSAWGRGDTENMAISKKSTTTSRMKVKGHGARDAVCGQGLYCWCIEMKENHRILQAKTVSKSKNFISRSEFDGSFIKMPFSTIKI